MNSWRSLSVLVVLAAAPVAPVLAQMDSVPARAAAASPMLPLDHWAARAARRAEAMGLAPSFYPAQGAATRAEALGALREMAARAQRPADRALAQRWLSRFREEFTEQAHAGWTGGSAGAGYAEEFGRLAPARGNFDHVDPLPLAGDAGGLGSLSGGVQAGPGLAAAVRLIASDDHAEAAQWEVVAAARPLALSVGRAPVRYGPAVSGGLVMGGDVALPRVELRTVGAPRLPWAFRALGRVSAQTFVTQLREARHDSDPWLWGARVAFRPHDRVTLAVNRASMFGGDSAVTFTRLAKMLVGQLSPGFENQILSFDGRYRPPTEAWLPLNLYAEWAADDGAGAFDEQPAFLLGAEVPGLPGLPEVALGVEVTRVEGCCGHGAWYQNTSIEGNWVARERPLGPALGGEGSEIAGRLSVDLFDARLRLDGRGFVRNRSDESPDRPQGSGNLFAPVRRGQSTGGLAQANLRLGAGAELFVRAYGDFGDGWREHRLEMELSYLFR